MAQQGPCLRRWEARQAPVGISERSCMQMRCELAHFPAHFPTAIRNPGSPMALVPPWDSHSEFFGLRGLNHFRTP